MSLSSPSRSPALPLGALAAGFGLSLSSAFAQTAAPVPAPAASSATEATLPQIRVKAAAEATGKEAYQATQTRIGKGQQELRDIPQSITVVTEKLIDDRNQDTLKDALHNTAGITFQAAEGGEEDIRLRGFSLATSGDIFVDGIRDPAFYDRDTFNYDRLELLRGSASMLFGRGSTGGAVNQVNKQPMPITQHEVSATMGSGGYLRATGDFNIKTGDNAALRVNAMNTVADNYGAKIDKQGLAGAFNWGIGTADEFSVGLYYLNNDNGINYGMPWLRPSSGSVDRVLIPIDAKNYYGMASDYNRGSASYGTLSHTHRFQGGGELRTTLRAGRYERDLRASTIRFCAAGAANPDCPSEVTAETLTGATVLTRGAPTKIQDMDTKYLQSDYSGKFDWFGLNHAVLSGVDVAHEDFSNYAASAVTKPRTAIGTPNDGARIDESARTLSLNRTFEAKALGIYFQDLVQVAPSWKILAGLRWDRMEGNFWGAATTGNNPQPEATRSRSDSLWSKRFGVLYQPTPLSSFHLSYGTSFNTSGDTYQYDALGSNTPPESSRNIELGAKLDSSDGNFTTRFALFHSTKYNERNRDELSTNETNYVLSAQRHAAGFDIDITGRITPAWEVFGSYAWIPKAKIDKGTSVQGEVVGSRPGLTPVHAATLWSTYKLTPSWRVGGGVNLRSKQQPQLVTDFHAPGYATADVMAEYTQGALSYKLSVTNVADKLYADMLYRGHYIAGAPRTVQFTGTYKF